MKEHLARLKTFYFECLRVLRVTRKPGSFEYKTIVKVSGLGMAIIGLIGFFVSMIKQVFF
tara:strand:- start:1069 stop:1248 length:180 start_codon:yes stop_codon:yes gene_type:complete